MIPCARSEVLPHKLQHLLTLLHARKTRWLLLPQRRHLLLIKLIVSMHIPRPHQQNIAKPDLSPLRLSHSLQIPKRNRRGSKRIMLASLRQSPLMVIKQHAPSNNPLLAPRADPIYIAARFPISPVDIIERNAIIKHFLLLVAEMPQAVPLRRRLRVEGPDVVVDDARRFLVELLVEGLAAEEGEGALGVCSIWVSHTVVIAKSYQTVLARPRKQLVNIVEEGFLMGFFP
jgi:hypothetical protein